VPTQPERLTRRRQRVLRLRQGLAVALVAAALVVVAVYALRRHHQAAELARAAPAPAHLLGLKIRQSAAGVTVAKSVAGRPAFRLVARRADTLRANGHDLLYDVHILVYEKDGVHADSISGSEFGYDSRSGGLEARGTVHIELAARPGNARQRPSPPVRLVAHDLAYNVKQGIGTIAHGVTFALGTAAGSAGAARLDSRAGYAEFSGGVGLQWRRPGRPPLTVTAQQALLRRLAPHLPEAASIELAGGARLLSGSQTLTADRLTLFLRRDRSLRRLLAAGHIHAADALPGRHLTVAAATASAGFAPGRRQVLNRLTLTGAVDARQLTAARNSRLSAGQVDFVYSPAGVLRQVRASQGAALTLSGAQRQTLRAPELDFLLRSAAAGAAPTQLRLAAIVNRGRATLVSGGDTAAADVLRLDLDPAGLPSLATASGKVRLSQTVAGSARTSRSDRLELRFATVAGKAQLRQAVATGHVVVRQDTRRIAADAMTYSPASGQADFAGHVLASAPQARFSAAHVVWIAAPAGGGRLEARGGVALSLLGAGGATFGVGPQSGSASPQPVVVTAATLDWTEPPGPHPAASRAGLPLDPSAGSGLRGTAVFRGAVRLLQSPNLLRADAVTLQGHRALSATGHVQTTLLAPGAKPRPVTITAQSLRYTAATREAVYGGGAALLVDNARLAAPELDAWLRPNGGLQRAQAFRGVRVTQPGRTASAATVNYDFATGRIELRGGPPSIFDAEQGKVMGDPLTFSLSSDEIQVGSKSGVRATGQFIAHK
jgi:lipopolysaccharide export system protein LptA